MCRRLYVSETARMYWLHFTACIVQCVFIIPLGSAPIVVFHRAFAPLLCGSWIFWSTVHCWIDLKLWYSLRLRRLQTVGRKCCQSLCWCTRFQGLFAVTLSLATGGSAALFSTISIPFLEDYEKLLAEKHYKGPSEPVHADPYIRNPAKERRKLQVQKILNDPEKVVDASSRLTIGYVIKGGFSFHAAHNVGLGYCSLLGFLRLMQDRMDVSKQILQKKSIQVLVRGPHSFQYNFADMEVLCSQSSLI